MITTGSSGPTLFVSIKALESTGTQDSSAPSKQPSIATVAVLNRKMKNRYGNLKQKATVPSQVPVVG